MSTRQPPSRPGNGPGRRPTVGSRNPTARPRRVAGQPTPSAPDVDLGGGAGGDVEVPASPVRLDKTTAPAETRTPEGRGARGLSAQTLRRVLVGAICALLLIGAAEVFYLAFTDNEAEPGTVTADQPVQVSELTVRSVVDQAAKAATTILSADYESYDEGVEAAAALMTDPFAEKFRETKQQVREEFIANQTQVVVDISAQGVMRADADQVVALLFLTQTTAKNKSSVTPVQYRVEVTMVKTSSGWLVSDLQAR